MYNRSLGLGSASDPTKHESFPWSIGDHPGIALDTQSIYGCRRPKTPPPCSRSRPDEAPVRRTIYDHVVAVPAADNKQEDKQDCKDDQNIYCEYCDMTFTDSKTYDLHCKGFLHTDSVQRKKRNKALQDTKNSHPGPAGGNIQENTALNCILKNSTHLEMSSSRMPPPRIPSPDSFPYENITSIYYQNSDQLATQVSSALVTGLQTMYTPATSWSNPTLGGGQQNTKNSSSGPAGGDIKGKVIRGILKKPSTHLGRNSSTTPPPKMPSPDSIPPKQPQAKIASSNNKPSRLPPPRTPTKDDSSSTPPPKIASTDNKPITPLPKIPSTDNKPSAMPPPRIPSKDDSSSTPPPKIASTDNKPITPSPNIPSTDKKPSTMPPPTIPSKDKPSTMPKMPSPYSSPPKKPPPKISLKDDNSSTPPPSIASMANKLSTMPTPRIASMANKPSTMPPPRIASMANKPSTMPPPRIASMANKPSTMPPPRIASMANKPSTMPPPRIPLMVNKPSTMPPPRIALMPNKPSTMPLPRIALMPNKPSTMPPPRIASMPNKPSTISPPQIASTNSGLYQNMMLSNYQSAGQLTTQVTSASVTGGQTMYTPQQTVPPRSWQPPGSAAGIPRAVGLMPPGVTTPSRLATTVANTWSTPVAPCQTSTVQQWPPTQLPPPSIMAGMPPCIAKPQDKPGSVLGQAHWSTPRQLIQSVPVGGMADNVNRALGPVTPPVSQMSLPMVQHLTQPSGPIPMAVSQVPPPIGQMDAPMTSMGLTQMPPQLVQQVATPVGPVDAVTLRQMQINAQVNQVNSGMSHLVGVPVSGWTGRQPEVLQVTSRGPAPPGVQTAVKDSGVNNRATEIKSELKVEGKADNGDDEIAKEEVEEALKIIRERKRQRKKQEENKHKDPFANCAVCHAVVPDHADAWSDHIKGKKHFVKFFSRILLMGAEQFYVTYGKDLECFHASRDILEAAANERDPYKLFVYRSGVSSMLFCKVCFTRCVSLDTWVIHVAGKKHLTRCEELVEKEGMEAFLKPQYPKVPVAFLAKRITELYGFQRLRKVFPSRYCYHGMKMIPLSTESSEKREQTQQSKDSKEKKAENTGYENSPGLAGFISLQKTAPSKDNNEKIMETNRHGSKPDGDRRQLEVDAYLSEVKKRYRTSSHSPVSKQRTSQQTTYDPASPSGEDEQRDRRDKALDPKSRKAAGSALHRGRTKDFYEQSPPRKRKVELVNLKDEIDDEVDKYRERSSSPDVRYKEERYRSRSPDMKRHKNLVPRSHDSGVDTLIVGSPNDTRNEKTNMVVVLGERPDSRGRYQSFDEHRGSEKRDLRRVSESRVDRSLSGDSSRISDRERAKRTHEERSRGNRSERSNILSDHKVFDKRGEMSRHGIREREFVDQPRTLSRERRLDEEIGENLSYDDIYDERSERENSRGNRSRHDQVDDRRVRARSTNNRGGNTYSLTESLDEVSSGSITYRSDKDDLNYERLKTNSRTYDRLRDASPMGREEQRATESRDRKYFRSGDRTKIYEKRMVRSDSPDDRRGNYLSKSRDIKIIESRIHEIRSRRSPELRTSDIVVTRNLSDYITDDIGLRGHSSERKLLKSGIDGRSDKNRLTRSRSRDRRDYDNVTSRSRDRRSPEMKRHVSPNFADEHIEQHDVRYEASPFDEDDLKRDHYEDWRARSSHLRSRGDRSRSPLHRSEERRPESSVFESRDARRERSPHFRSRVESHLHQDSRRERSRSRDDRRDYEASSVRSRDDRLDERRVNTERQAFSAHSVETVISRDDRREYRDGNRSTREYLDRGQSKGSERHAEYERRKESSVGRDTYAEYEHTRDSSGSRERHRERVRPSLHGRDRNPDYDQERKPSVDRERYAQYERELSEVSVDRSELAVVSDVAHEARYSEEIATETVIIDQSPAVEILPNERVPDQQQALELFTAMMQEFMLRFQQESKPQPASGLVADEDLLAKQISEMTGITDRESVLNAMRVVSTMNLDVVERLGSLDPAIIQQIVLGLQQSEGSSGSDGQIIIQQLLQALMEGKLDPADLQLLAQQAEGDAEGRSRSRSPSRHSPRRELRTAHTSQQAHRYSDRKNFRSNKRFNFQKRGSFRGRGRGGRFHSNRGNFRGNRRGFQHRKYKFFG